MMTADKLVPPWRIGSMIAPQEMALYKNHRILVVDDSDSIQEDFRKILGDDAAEAGFDAEEAAIFGQPTRPSGGAQFTIDFAFQGEEALALVCDAVARGEPYALVFTDMRMPPGWDGLETTQKLWEVDPDLQIVICTAYSDRSWEELSDAAGSRERLLILKKPFDTIEVLQFAHALTEKWSLLQAARVNTAALEGLVDERTSELCNLNALLQTEIGERNQAEQMARQSEGEQRALAAQLAAERTRLVAAQSVAKVGDWDFDLVTKVRSWSAETHRIFEFDGEDPQLLRDWFLRIVHPDDLAAVNAKSAASLTERGPSVQQHRLLMPDGRIKHVEQRWQVFHNEEGEPLRAAGTVQDITARAEAQEILRRSEMNLAVAQSVSHTGSWEIALDSDVPEDDRDVHWSDEEFRIFGFEPGAVQATQRLFFQCVHVDDRERIATAFATALKSGAGFESEHRIIWPDGTEREIYERAELVRDSATGVVTKVIGTTQDITERKNAERTLREQAEMLNLAHDAIVIRGAADRLITFWNKGAEHLYGWTASEAVGRRIDDLLYADLEHYLTVAHAVELTGEFRGEVHQVTKDGRKLIVSARASLVRHRDGSPKAVLIIQTDVTEHRKLESQFLRAQRLESIGTLASGVAHDLNNVLAPILMSAPLLREELASELKNKIVDTIEKSAERGAQIVKQVLTFARGVDGERVLLDPSHLIEEMAKIAEQTFPKNIAITSRYPQDLALLDGDPTQLHQVLLNLAVNARDAMPGGGKLVLAAENFDVDEHYAAMTPGISAGPHVLITVTDTGTGIPAHVMEKMFDPFFTTKEVGKGSGLGLSTLLGIVKSHEGAVTANSTPAGTTFRILLPAAPGGQQLVPVNAASELPCGHGETILVVDDEPSICDVAQVLLAKNGYNVLVADDGPAALALYAQRRGEIALVLTDLLMPLMNGLSLARIIRKMDAAATIVLSTGREEDCDAAELAAVGIAAALTKPYTQHTLLRTLHRALHDRRSP